MVSTERATGDQGKLSQIKRIAGLAFGLEKICLLTADQTRRILRVQTNPQIEC